MNKHECKYNQAGMECPAHEELVEIAQLRNRIEELERAPNAWAAGYDVGFEKGVAAGRILGPEARP